MSNEKEEFLAKYGSAEHIDKLLEHPNSGVRINCVNNPHANKDHLQKLSKDSHVFVRQAVTSAIFDRSRFSE